MSRTLLHNRASMQQTKAQMCQIFSGRVRAMTDGVTDQALADAVSVSVRAVRYWRGGSRMPPATILARLAAHLNTSMDYLVGRRDDP